MEKRNTSESFRDPLSNFDIMRFETETIKQDCVYLWDMANEWKKYISLGMQNQEVVPGKFIQSLMDRGYCRILFNPEKTQELRRDIVRLQSGIFRYLDDNEHTSENFIYDNVDQSQIRFIGEENEKKPHDPKIGIQVNQSQIHELNIPGVSTFADDAFEFNLNIIKLVDTYLLAKYSATIPIEDQVCRTTSFVRFVNYPPIDLMQVNNYNSNQIKKKKVERHFPHSDTTLITAIRGDNSNGLEGYDENEKDWNRLTVLPGEVLVMLGQPFSLVSGGIFPHFRHRVVANTDAKEHELNRMVAVVGTRPNTETFPLTYNNQKIYYDGQELLSWEHYAKLKLKK
jgi:hypothetical protein